MCSSPIRSSLGRWHVQMDSRTLILISVEKHISDGHILSLQIDKALLQGTLYQQFLQSNPAQSGLFYRESLGIHSRFEYFPTWPRGNYTRSLGPALMLQKLTCREETRFHPRTCSPKKRSTSRSSSKSTRR